MKLTATVRSPLFSALLLCSLSALFSPTNTVAQTTATPAAEAQETEAPAASSRELLDVTYVPESASEQEKAACKLDLFFPEGYPQSADAKKKFATIIWLHGGGIVGGKKNDSGSKVVAQRFVGEGYAVVSVNYRLSPNVEYPAYLDDVARAVAYVHEHIAEYGGDPKRIFLSGHSAGAYLAAMVATDPRLLAKVGMKPTDLAGCIPVSGHMFTHFTVRKERGVPRTRPMIDEAAPAWHVSKELPPMLLIVGGEDMISRAEENAFFAIAMKSVGHNDTLYLEVEGRNHGTIVNRMKEPDDTVAVEILKFLDKYDPK